MNSHFLNGFADELTKEASHPLISGVKAKGTLLGRQVKGMMARAMKKGKVVRHRMKKKAGMANLTDGAPVGRASSAGRVTGPKASKIAPKKETDFGFGGAKKTPSSNATIGKAIASRSDLMASSKKSLGHSAKKPTKMGNKLMAPSFGTGGGTMYGGGKGNFGGTQAPAFTADTKKGKIGNPSENPQNFGKK
jgi:hypothetical protein